MCYIPSPSYDISLNLDVIRKASRTCLFPEIQDWRFEMKMLYNMGQLLSVSLSSVERVLRSFRRARTGVGHEGSLTSVVHSLLMYSIHKSPQNSALGSSSNDLTVVIRLKYALAASCPRALLKSSRLPELHK